MEFDKYKDAVKYLFEVPKFYKKTNHDNTAELFRAFGNPQDQLKVIHAAGTNGKGSVCRFTQSILTAAGYKVGLFTSPHLESVNERIRIGSDIIEDERFAQIFTDVKVNVDHLIERGYRHPAFFEFLFVMAMVYFEQERVDYAVIETGMGGSMDVTNLISEPIMTVITSIGFDHTKILGETLAEITAQKAGIIKTGVPVVYDGEKEEVCYIIEETIEKVGALSDPGSKITKQSYKIYKKTKKDIDFSPLCSYYDKSIFTIPFIAEYQCGNARLAIAAIEGLKLNISREDIKIGLGHAVWEGRMEQIWPRVFIDGSHNPDGIREFVKIVSGFYNHKKILIFSSMKEKDFSANIKTIGINAMFDAIIVTELENVKTASADELKQCFEEYVDVPVYEIEDNAKAFEFGLELKGEEDVLFATGSLYLAGSLKRIVSTI